MAGKTYTPEGELPPASQIGATLEALAATIAARRQAGEESYTHRLLCGPVDDVLKKVMEESGEVALAAKDASCAAVLPDGGVADAAEPSGTPSCPSAAGGRAEAQPTLASGQSGAPEGSSLTGGDLRGEAVDAAIDHLRYEAADVVYHLMVVLERFGIPLDEFAAELNNRMTDAERPTGAVRLQGEHVRRGK